MSKAIELLERVIDGGGSYFAMEQLDKEIEDFLAQPEQEPVAYAYDYLDSLYYADDKDVAEYPRISRDGKPLYAALPKPETLSEEQIWTANSDQAFKDGVRFAENYRWRKYDNKK